eukprot:4730681-Alexandrium_andersonii.AAC.1
MPETSRKTRRSTACSTHTPRHRQGLEESIAREFARSLLLASEHESARMHRYCFFHLSHAPTVER